MLMNSFSHDRALQWRHNERGGVSNHKLHDCLLNRLFRHKWKKTSKLCVNSLCEGNSWVTGEFPTQRASNAEDVYIWWRRHGSCDVLSKLCWAKVTLGVDRHLNKMITVDISDITFWVDFWMNNLWGIHTQDFNLVRIKFILQKWHSWFIWEYVIYVVIRLETYSTTW